MKLIRIKFNQFSIAKKFATFHLYYAKNYGNVDRLKKKTRRKLNANNYFCHLLAPTYCK